MTNQNLIKKIIRWLLAVVIVLYLISGVGITEFRTVETLTFGLLTQALAFKIHNNLEIPFIILLGGHVFFPLALMPFLGLRKQRNKAASD